MEYGSELSTEELRVLKELSRNLLAAGRVRRILTTAVLWAASIIGAGYILVEFWGKIK